VVGCLAAKNCTTASDASAVLRVVGFHCTKNCTPTSNNACWAWHARCKGDNPFWSATSRVAGFLSTKKNFTTSNDAVLPHAKCKGKRPSFLAGSTAVGASPQKLHHLQRYLGHHAHQVQGKFSTIVRDFTVAGFRSTKNCTTSTDAWPSHTKCKCTGNNPFWPVS
jgi:uncharacterized membrane protein